MNVLVVNCGSSSLKYQLIDMNGEVILAKGLVERKIIQIITPGTTTNDGTLTEDKNNYIMCLSFQNDIYGVATADVSTGKFMCAEVHEPSKVIDEITKFEPSEIVIPEDLQLFENSEYQDLFDLQKQKLNITISRISKTDYGYENCVARLENQFHTNGIEGLGLKDMHSVATASGALLSYLLDTEMDSIRQINNLKVYYVTKYMIIDTSTRRNLELTETLRDKQRIGSLLWVLDSTKTAMGARLLRSYVEMPLLDKDKIEDRLDAVDSMNKNVISRDEMREYLNSIYDLERLMTKISIHSANARDLLSFRNSLKYLPFIHNLIHEMSGNIFETMDSEFDELQDLYNLIYSAISEDAPITLREGGIFKTGYNSDIDHFKKLKSDSKEILNSIEEKERNNSGIKTLKIKFNRVYGYFFEVTNSFKDKVPDYFIRKQTLTNAERYTTTELQTISDEILGSEDKLYGLEYDEFVKLRDRIALNTERVQKTASDISTADALASLSYIAVKNHYVRPSINDDGIININGGRHPVIEKMMKSGSFVPNDTFLDTKSNRIMIITGPNMAGKSTYMRQTAIISLMSQIGSFVPADSADICISDRIFTRVGASDDLSQGQSTFMVEMSEVANILRNATKKSLIIMDEIGRGTSTFDGLSIAWAVVEYIADSEKIGAKTLFATHYHELTELEGKLSSVNNYCIAIKETKTSLVFLRKIVRGEADRSYGIEVAKLAGLPKAVTNRANEIAEKLAEDDSTGNVKNIKAESVHRENPAKKNDNGQLSMFGRTEDISIVAELRNLDLDNITPVKAMLYLQELKDRLTK